MKIISIARRARVGRVTPLTAALSLALVSGLAASSMHAIAEVTEMNAQPPAASATNGMGRYIVQLRDAPVATYAGEIAGLARPDRIVSGRKAGKPDLQSAPAVAYVEYLESRQQAFVDSIGESFGRNVVALARMQHALNAVIVELTAAEAAELEQRPDVRQVEAERQEQLHMDNSPAYIGATQIWAGNTHSSVATKGEGILVGIIDTGINWQSPAFAAVDPNDGYVHVNPFGAGTFRGNCALAGVDVGRCNDKLVGMYNFASVGASATDTQGHGSHTASTVAGNRWSPIFANGPFTISGIAPRANVIAYLACPSTCPTTATTQSVNQAVIDGVDVINFSISGGTSPWTDTTSTAFRNANAAGVFVAASAGNTSTATPNPQGQVNHLEPWVETVAASTQNRFIGVPFNLDGGPAGTQSVPVKLGGAPNPTVATTGVPLVKSPNFANGSTDGCSPYPAGTFTFPSFPAEHIFRGGFDTPVTPVGAIAVLNLDGTNSSCASGARRTAALNAGAVGVIFVDAIYLNLGASGTTWSMLRSDWDIIEAAMTPSMSSASIGITAASFPAVGDLVAEFSFRGPRLIGGQGMVKPDITGPGVDILAAGAASVVGVNGVFLSNGTSMSSPNMAGAAALLRALNPSWTPPQVKSALNLSANNFGSANQDGSPVRLWDYGSGRVNLAAASKVGLVMDETAANFLAANPTTGGNIASLNLASMARYNFTGTYTFTRTFQRARSGSQTYNLSVVGLPAGSTTITPSSFTIAAAGSQTVTFAVDSALLTAGTWTLGEVLVTPAAGDEPDLKMPIAVQRTP